MQGGTGSGQIPQTTKLLVETTVANALAGIRKEIVAIETRSGQTVKAERKEREGQFVGLRNEFRDQQQVVRSEVAELCSLLRKLEDVQKPVAQEMAPASDLDALRKEIASMKQSAEEFKQKTAAASDLDVLRKEIASMKQWTEESKQTTAVCISSCQTLKEELKGLQKTMFEWQAFRVKQEANMAKVLKLFDDHNDDFQNIKRFDTDIQALVDQMRVSTDNQMKFNADLAKAKKKTSECIDTCQEIRNSSDEINKKFEEYQKECDELSKYIPESKKSSGMSLFDRMKVMFHKEHKLQPLVDHMEDLKNMIGKTFAALEGELRSGLQKEKEEHLLSTISLDRKLDDYLNVEKRQAERVNVLENTMQEYGAKVDSLTAAVPDKAAISKQLMESVHEHDMKFQQLVEKISRHGEELAQQKQRSDTLQVDFTRRNDSLQGELTEQGRSLLAEITKRSNSLQEDLTKRGDSLQEDLTKRSSALPEMSRKYTAETFHALRKAQLQDVQAYVSRQLDDLKKENVQTFVVQQLEEMKKEIRDMSAGIFVLAPEEKSHLLQDVQTYIKQQLEAAKEEVRATQGPGSFAG